MKLSIDVPVFKYVTTTRDAYKIAMGTESVEVELPEYSSAEISKAISFKTKEKVGENEQVHTYYAADGKLIKKTGVSLDLSDLQKPVCLPKRRLNDNHPFFSDIFASFYHFLHQHGGGLSKWATKNVIPVKLGSFLDDSSDPYISLDQDSIELEKTSALPIRDYNGDMFKEQINDFKNRMKDFILVDGEIYQFCLEPIVEVRYASAEKNPVVIMSQSSLDYRNIKALVAGDKYGEHGININEGTSNVVVFNNPETSKKEMFRNLFIPLNEVDRTSEILVDMGFDDESIEFLVSDVEIYEPGMFSASYGALTTLNYCVDLAERFAKFAAVWSKPGVTNTISLAENKLRNLSVDELKLYQDLMTAIDNASPFEVTQELDDCIAGIKNLYAPGVEKTGFGDGALVEKICAVIDDEVVFPVEEYDGLGVPYA